MLELHFWIFLFECSYWEYYWLDFNSYRHCGQLIGRLQLKCDGTRWRMGGEVKGKLANGVGRQYSSH
jgi:hypothetical protein